MLLIVRFWNIWDESFCPVVADKSLLVGSYWTDVQCVKWPTARVSTVTPSPLADFFPSIQTSCWVYRSESRLNLKFRTYTFTWLLVTWIEPHGAPWRSKAEISWRHARAWRTDVSGGRSGTAAPWRGCGCTGAGTSITATAMELTVRNTGCFFFTGPP